MPVMAVPPGSRRKKPTIKRFVLRVTIHTSAPVYKGMVKDHVLRNLPERQEIVGDGLQAQVEKVRVVVDQQ